MYKECISQVVSNIFFIKQKEKRSAMLKKEKTLCYITTLTVMSVSPRCEGAALGVRE
jgi:hypothetical protein